jgi:hypothetical protein
MQFVFCILFFYAVWFLFQQICCNFIISNIREGKVVNAQIYVFYFESDIAKFFPSDLPVVLMIPR